ncbi:MAG: hypothetical protein RR313_00100 [Anaerovoracaceae bacterium]
MKKKKSKDKQAAKLKELRKEANTETNLALAITEEVKAIFNMVGVTNVWDRIDEYRVLHKGEWDNRCFLPFTNYIDAVFPGMPVDTQLELDMTSIVIAVDKYKRISGDTVDTTYLANEICDSELEEAKHLLPAVAAWRQHKQIFKVDADFLENLLITDDVYTVGAQNIITSKELESLPFPSFYVDAPFNSPSGPVGGFFFCYNSMYGFEGTNKLHFYMLKPIDLKSIKAQASASMLLNSCFRHEIYFNLFEDSSNMTIWDCYQKSCWADSPDTTTPEQIEEQTERQKKSFPLFFNALQILIYLASQFADVKENPYYKKSYKHTPIIQDIPTEIKHWDVGVRMGSVIRAVNNSKNKTTKPQEPQTTKDPTEQTERKKSESKRPHSRRAHWQYYWFGKRDGSEARYRRLKFVESTFVNFKVPKMLDNIPAVYHPVISFD